MVAACGPYAGRMQAVCGGDAGCMRRGCAPADKAKGGKGRKGRKGKKGWIPPSFPAKAEIKPGDDEVLKPERSA